MVDPNAISLANGADDASFDTRMKMLVQQSLAQVIPTLTQQITSSVSKAVTEAILPNIADTVRQAMVPLREEIDPRIDNVERDVGNIFRDSIRLWGTVEWQDQASRAGYVKIFGKPHTPGEDLKKIVLAILNKIDIELDESGISRCQRVKAHNGATAILVRFVDEDVRSKVMKNKKKLANIDTMISVKIFESLTGARSAVMRKLNGNPAVAKIWTVGGKLKVALRTAAIEIQDEQRFERCTERYESDTECLMSIGHFDELAKLCSVGFDDQYISDLMDCAKRGRIEY